jgi:acetolactate synthase-1/2/3 large subunit
MNPSMTGAEIIVRSLIDAGVDVVFGFPGGAVIPLYDALYGVKEIRHILTRHEQGAAHAADGYARATGKAGVCIATSGPGATNLVTGLATAHMDSSPLVALTGQVPVSMIGNDSFQEADIYGISIPVTKYNYLVKDAARLAQSIKEAFHIATTGRPGPVLIDIPKDLQIATVTRSKTGAVKLPGYAPVTKGHPRKVDAMIKALETARRPVVYAGGGVISSSASEQLRGFVQKTRIPITTTLMGKGVYPENDLLHLGMPGMHGTKYANMAIYESDLIVALGVRFDDRVAGDVSRFAPLAKVVHVDIDAAEIGKRVGTDIPIVGDLKSVLSMVTEKVNNTKRDSWLERVAELKSRFPLTYKEDSRTIKPQAVIKTLSDLTGGHIIVTTDVGQHQMWAAQWYKATEPRRFISSGGLGTMGFGFPAAIGAQVARPDMQVVCISGDGSFQMCIQELATVRQYDLPVKIFIMNNGCLGMVRQWQEFFCDRRYSQTCFEFNPDFCTVAEGYGIENFRVVKPKEVKTAVEKALEARGPVLVDFLVAREENVLPMIPAGRGQTDFVAEGEN